MELSGNGGVKIIIHTHREARYTRKGEKSFRKGGDEGCLGQGGVSLGRGR